MNPFTDIFQGFCLDFKNTFFPELLSVAQKFSGTKFSLEMNNKEFLIVLVLALWFLITHV